MSEQPRKPTPDAPDASEGAGLVDAIHGDPSSAAPSAEEQRAKAPAGEEPPPSKKPGTEIKGPELAKTKVAPPKDATDEQDPQAQDAVVISLPVYDGPLDLLLHLIRKHELDILDIPISFVTEKYLAYLDLMQDLKIDVASEYLVMAATLAHIKSKMLLPPDPTDADGDEDDLPSLDPRTELVKRLLEYQKYKQAAASLGSRDALNRDVFERGSAEPESDEEPPLAPGNVFRLFDAFERVLKKAEQTADHKILFERVSIAQRIVELTEMLQERERIRFEEMFVAPSGDAPPQPPSRYDLVVTFLALLEMGKMRMLHIEQDDALGEIWVNFAPERVDGDDEPAPEEGEPLESDDKQDDPAPEKGELQQQGATAPAPDQSTNEQDWGQQQPADLSDEPAPAPSAPEQKREEE